MPSIPWLAFVTGTAFPNPLRVFFFSWFGNIDFSLKESFLNLNCIFLLQLPLLLKAFLLMGKIRCTSIHFRCSSGLFASTYYSGTSLFVRTLIAALLLTVFYTGRKQDEITVIYYLSITWESGLWWLVCHYVRCLQQSRNWTNIIHSSFLLCNKCTSLSLLGPLQFDVIKNTQVIFHLTRVHCGQLYS